MAGNADPGCRGLGPDAHRDAGGAAARRLPGGPGAPAAAHDAACGGGASPLGAEGAAASRPASPCLPCEVVAHTACRVMTTKRFFHGLQGQQNLATANGCFDVGNLNELLAQLPAAEGGQTTVAVRPRGSRTRPRQHTEENRRPIGGCKQNTRLAPQQPGYPLACQRQRCLPLDVFGT